VTGHGCFYTYLYRIGKADSPLCPYCELDNDSAEHTLQACQEWRELMEKLGPDIRLPMIMHKICEDKDAWKAFLKFAEEVMLKKEQDERIRQRAALEIESD